MKTTFVVTGGHCNDSYNIHTSGCLSVRHRVVRWGLSLHYTQCLQHSDTGAYLHLAIDIDAKQYGRARPDTGGMTKTAAKKTNLKLLLVPIYIAQSSCILMCFKYYTVLQLHQASKCSHGKLDTCMTIACDAVALPCILSQHSCVTCDRQLTLPPSQQSGLGQIKQTKRVRTNRHDRRQVDMRRHDTTVTKIPRHRHLAASFCQSIVISLWLAF